MIELPICSTCTRHKTPECRSTSDRLRHMPGDVARVAERGGEPEATTIRSVLFYILGGPVAGP